MYSEYEKMNTRKLSFWVFFGRVKSRISIILFEINQQVKNFNRQWNFVIAFLLVSSSRTPYAVYESWMSNLLSTLRQKSFTQIVLKMSNLNWFRWFFTSLRRYLLILYTEHTLIYPFKNNSRGFKINQVSANQFVLSLTVRRGRLVIHFGYYWSHDILCTWMTVLNIASE